MALKTRRSRPWLTRLHLILRLLGLTGLLAALAGIVLRHVQHGLPNLERLGPELLDSLQGEGGDPSLMLSAYLFAAGVGVVFLVLLAEAVAGSRRAAFGRSALGLNAAFQVLLAVALLAGINWFSFESFTQIDCTRDRQFTLPEKEEKELRKLRGETTIVVLQQRRKTELAAGQFEDYDAAAEAVLIEKVRDLAEQLRRFSAQQLSVVILDARKKEYRGQLATVTEKRPVLAAAIKDAPENSLLFHTIDDLKREQVQRMSFDAFMQLDKTASREAHGGKGNLVMLQKGVAPVVTRLIGLEERKPRVGFLTMHPLLSTKGTLPMYTAGGLGNTLASQGYEVRDIVLKSDTTGDPTGATIEELRVEELRDLQMGLDEAGPAIERTLNTFKQMAVELPKANLLAFSRKYPRQLARLLQTEDDRAEVLEVLKLRITQFTASLLEVRKRQEETRKDLEKLNVEEAEAQRRMSDLRGKMTRLVSDCDLLILTRHTRLPQGATLGGAFNEFYRLDDAQLSAVKEFLKQGKPILFCLGPSNEQDSPETAPRQMTDSLELLLAQLGVYTSPQTVLFDVQAQDFAEQRRRRFQQINIAPVPSVGFGALDEKEPNGLARSLGLTSRVAGSKLDLGLHYPRPVYYDPTRGSQKIIAGVLAQAPLGGLAALPPLMLPASAAQNRGVFLFSDSASWNDDHPFATAERPVPQFRPADLKDPTRGTADERRRGPFPLGVAVETEMPADWYSPGEGTPKTARIAVIGHGGVFVDPVLSPARQALLLDSCNWLLGRDDLLNREGQEWSYPRVALSEVDKELWLWGTRLGLPALFAYFGLIVLLVRRAF